jgi:uncharacterized UBP type Zn finger protein
MIVAMPRLETVSIEAPCDRPAEGCRDCLAIGGRWVHLRTCLTCGGVRCCDSSPGRHATKHFHESGHPIVTSAEPGETWVWCYAHEEAISS